MNKDTLINENENTDPKIALIKGYLLELDALDDPLLWKTVVYPYYKNIEISSDDPVDCIQLA